MVTLRLSLVPLLNARRACSTQEGAQIRPHKGFISSNVTAERVAAEDVIIRLYEPTKPHSVNLPTWSSIMVRRRVLFSPRLDLTELRVSLA